MTFDYNKELIKHLEALKSHAVLAHPAKELDKYERYYYGKFKSDEKVTNQRNVIKGVVDTKATLVDDAQMVTAVMPTTRSMSDIQQIGTMNDIADILQDCIENNNKINKFKTKRMDLINCGLISGLGIWETVWDGESAKGLGDIKINQIEPKSFYPDPSAKTIEDCNYVFIKETYSPITLKAKYPDKADKIDKKSQSGNSTENVKSSPKSIHSVTSGGQSSLAYAETPSNLAQNMQDVQVWKCYLKDDSTFVAEELTEKNEGEKEKIEKIKQKYPNGRMILYLDGVEDCVLEDRPIEYPFGFPLDVFNPSKSNSIWGQSVPEDLCEIQDRINRAYSRRKSLIGSFISLLAIDEKCGVRPDQFINEVGVVKIRDLQRNMPQTVTNNTLSELVALHEEARLLKEDANDMGRVNTHMISGERQKGVTSGDQIEALNESPLSSIRSIQRNLAEFLVSVGNKQISLMQLYYNTQRIIRLSGAANQFAILPNVSEQEPGAIQIVEEKQQDQKRILEAIKEIQGNLTIGDYEVDVIAGTELPRSRTERANQTIELFNMGQLGQGLEATEELLTALDYQNRREVINRLRKQMSEQSQPTLSKKLEKMGIQFKDLPQFAQYQVLAELGIQIPEETTIEDVQKGLEIEKMEVEIENAKGRQITGKPQMPANI